MFINYDRVSHQRHWTNWTGEKKSQQAGKLNYLATMFNFLELNFSLRICTDQLVLDFTNIHSKGLETIRENRKRHLKWKLSYCVYFAWLFFDLENDIQTAKCILNSVPSKNYFR